MTMVYGTTKQYNELEAWVTENCPQYLDDFIGRDGFLPNRLGVRPIANFDKTVGVWIAANCPLEWFRCGMVQNGAMTKYCKLCDAPIVATGYGDYCSSDCRNTALVAQLMAAFSTDDEAADLERAMIEEGIIDLDDLDEM